MNELVQIFEGQEIKVKTDKGVTLINLAHTARCCGIENRDNGKNKIRWSNVKQKLKSINTTSGRDTKMSPQYIEEIDFILEEIENTDDRNSIYMSSWLSKRLAMESHSEKAMKYKDFLATLDEKREDLMSINNNVSPQAILQLAESMQMIGNVVQGMQNSINNMQLEVSESLHSKDEQIDRIAEMIGIRSKQTKFLLEFLKSKLSELLGMRIMATSGTYKKMRDKILLENNVLKWEDIAIGDYNRVHAYIDSIEREDVRVYQY